MKILALLAPLFLGGCISIVEVRTPDAPPALSVYPFGVKIQKANASDAMTVDVTTIGAAADTNCGVFGVGVIKASCAAIDARSCGIAIVHPDKDADIDFLARISGSTQAECLHNKERSP